jgi:hypothetical protein
MRLEERREERSCCARGRRTAKMRFLSRNEIKFHNRTSRPVDFEVDIVASRVYPEGLHLPSEDRTDFSSVEEYTVCPKAVGPPSGFAP